MIKSHTMYVLGTNYTLEQNLLDLMKFLYEKNKIFPIQIWVNDGKHHFKTTLNNQKELNAFVMGFACSKYWDKNVR